MYMWTLTKTLASPLMSADRFSRVEKVEEVDWLGAVPAVFAFLFSGWKMNKNWVSEKKKTETEEKGKCDRHIAGLNAKIAPRISETLFITTADNQPMWTGNNFQQTIKNNKRHHICFSFQHISSHGISFRSYWFSILSATCLFFSCCFFSSSI